ncbi:MAG: hypothetical protein AB1716_11495 [Planctomycetota bacterium]
MRKVVVVVFVTSLAAAAAGQSITTLFGGNNQGNAGGGVYFDATVAANPLRVLSFDVNTTATAGTPFGFEVYTRPGTYVGFTGSPNGWTLMATGTGTAAGVEQPSHVTLAAPFDLAANGVTGMALALIGGPGSAAHRYTNGTGSNQHYQNVDIALDLGAASNVLFSGSPFSPRVWNGTIYYSVIPEPAALGLLALGVLLRRR